MSWFGGAEKLLAKVNEIHEKFIETQTEFRLLREQTQRTLSEVQAAVTRISTKVDSMNLEETKAHAELKSEIRGVELRLNALSEQALHAVAEKVARDGFNATQDHSAKGRPQLPPSDTPD